MKKLCYGISVGLCIGSIFVFFMMMSAANEVSDAYGVLERAAKEAYMQTAITTASIITVGMLLVAAMFAVFGKLIEHNEFMEKAFLIANPEVKEKLTEETGETEKTGETEEKQLISDEELEAEALSYKPQD